MGKSNFHHRSKTNWLFIAPIMFLNIIVILGPSMASVYYAFTDWSGVGQASWIGLSNFIRIISDPVYRIALSNNIKWTLIFLTVPIAMGLIGSVLLAPIKRGQTFFRIAYFIPYVIASVVNAQIWRQILHPLKGIGPWLTQFGVDVLDIAFLGRESTALYTIAFIDNWHWWGFLVVVYLTATQALPTNYYEAATIEGANRWQEFWHITLPGIRPTLVFTLLMTIIWSVMVFDYIYVLTEGGPAFSSEVLSTQVFKAAFYRFEIGYAAAIGITMSLFCAAFIGIFVYLRRKGWEI